MPSIARGAACQPPMQKNARRFWRFARSVGAPRTAILRPVEIRPASETQALQAIHATGMKKQRKSTSREPSGDDTVSEVRIVGGKYRGRKLQIPVDPRTRPMKNRVREAIFNLIGTEVAGKHAIDLFAGTGALGIEALSRGAARATFIERHFPTAALIRRNLEALAAADRGEVIASDTFYWSRQQPELGDAPWVIFCSPPFEFYVSRTAEMLELLTGLMGRAPAGSLTVVEADEHFDMQRLPHAERWDVRSYPPAVVGIYRENAADA